MTLQPRPASEVASCDPYAVAVPDPAACYNPRIRALATTPRPSIRQSTRTPARARPHRRMRPPTTPQPRHNRLIGAPSRQAPRAYSPDAPPELVEAVALDALDALARSMEAELSTCQLTGDAGADAVRRLSAVGRGYVHFALAEPGRFATAFAPRTGAG